VAFLRHSESPFRAVRTSRILSLAVVQFYWGEVRLLVVIDEYTRECLAIEVGRSFTTQDVMGVLQVS